MIQSLKTLTILSKCYVACFEFPKSKEASILGLEEIIRYYSWNALYVSVYK